MHIHLRLIVSVWAVAVLVPLLVVWLGATLLSWATASPLLLVQERGPLLVQSILVGGPFALLAWWVQRAASQSPRVGRAGVLGAVLGGLALTLPPWAWLYATALTPHMGANIGAGLLLLVSPIYVGGGMVVGYALGQRWRRRP